MGRGSSVLKSHSVIAIPRGGRDGCAQAAEAKAQQERFLKLIVPGSYTARTVWTEVEELHLDY